MGGCCCSSRRHQLTGTPVYYYCPSFSEEHESLTSNDSAASSLTAGFLADLNLDMSTPDTFRSPPRPIPFDVVLGHPPSSLPDPIGDPGNNNNFRKSAADFKGRDVKGQIDGSLVPSRGTEMEKLKSTPVSVKEEEIDCCPTCLEEYDAENPKIVAKCNHHFHLSCILEWMERSDTCPICNQEMRYETL